MGIIFQLEEQIFRWFKRTSKLDYIVIYYIFQFITAIDTFLRYKQNITLYFVLKKI